MHPLPTLRAACCLPVMVEGGELFLVVVVVEMSKEFWESLPHP